MKQFRVIGIVSGSKVIGTFEAEDAEDAKRQAAESDECYVSLCHSCCNECDDAQILEFDTDEVK